MPKPEAERVVFPAEYDFSQEPFKRKPIRPLGEISDYVVEQLPQVLQAIDDKLVAEQQSLEQALGKPIDQFTPEERQILAERKAVLNDPVGKALSAQSESLLGTYGEEKLEFALTHGKHKDIAVIDVLYLRQAVVAHGGEVGPRLQAAIDTLSGKHETTVQGTNQTRVAYDRVPVITYADLIFTNPILQDPRTFLPLTTEAGREELDFYETHRQIEERLERINDAAFKAVDVLATKGVSGVHSAITELRKVGFISAHDQRRGADTSDTDFVVQNMNRVGRLRTEGKAGMTRDLFRVFRDYYPSYMPVPEGTPWNMEIKGASGKFSAGFPLLELLLAGDVLPRKRMEEDSLFGYQYYSQHERSRITKALEYTAEGKTLDALSYELGDPQELFDTLQLVDDFILHFRNAHSHGVNNQLPEVFEGKAAGTGGVGDVPGFFDERKYRHVVRINGKRRERDIQSTSKYFDKAQ